MEPPRASPRNWRKKNFCPWVGGGPIRKDKDFFFASFEGWREVVPFPLVTSTPPVELRNGKNFSQFGVRIYDPLTTTACTPAANCISGGGFVRQQFPNNEIPASRISPIAT